METVTGSESDGFGGVLGTEIAAADYEMTDEAAVNPYIGFAVDAESKDAAIGVFAGVYRHYFSGASA